MSERQYSEEFKSRVAERVPQVEQRANELSTCPVAGCGADIASAGENEIIGHIVDEHEAFLHPHWGADEVTEEDALYRLSQEARNPYVQESPAEEVELPPRMKEFLDRYLVFLMLLFILILIGWPFIIAAIF